MRLVFVHEHEQTFYLFQNETLKEKREKLFLCWKDEMFFVALEKLFQTFFKKVFCLNICRWRAMAEWSVDIIDL